MLSIVRCCCNSSSHSLGILSIRSILNKKPANTSPLLSHIVHYTDPSCRNTDSRGEKRKRRKSGKTRCDSALEVSFVPYKAPPVMDHDYKNLALKRPMSPHLSVVSMTVPATMSILQRITGVILTTYALFLSGGTLFLSNGIETYVSAIQSLDLSYPVVTAIKVVAGIPFAYHYCNGIRFVLWSSGRFISISEVTFTAKVAMFFVPIIVGVFAYINKISF